MATPSRVAHVKRGSLLTEAAYSTTVALKMKMAIVAFRNARDHASRRPIQSSRSRETTVDTALTRNAAVGNDSPSRLTIAIASGYPMGNVTIGAGTVPNDLSRSEERRVG